MTVAVTRHLPADEAGLFFIGFAIIQFLSVVCALGLETISLRHFGIAVSEKNINLARALARYTWKWAVTGSIVTGACLALLAPLVSDYFINVPSATMAFIMFSIALPFATVTLIVAHQFQGLGAIVTSAVLLSVAVPALVAAGVFAEDLDRAASVSFVYAGSCILTASLGVAALERRLVGERSEWLNGPAIWREAKPLWAVNVVFALGHWAGVFLVAFWETPESVSGFTAALRTAGLVSFVLVALNFIMAPRYAALYKKHAFDELRALAIMSVRLLAVVSLPILAVLLINADAVMALFGVEYGRFQWVLVVLALGQAVNVVTGPVGNLLTMSGHGEVMKKIVLASTAASIAVGMVLTPLFGPIGAAVATAFGVALQNVVASWKVQSILGINVLHAFHRSLPTRS